MTVDRLFSIVFPSTRPPFATKLPTPCWLLLRLAREESIMKLFKFVSNIEISFILEAHNWSLSKDFSRDVEGWRVMRREGQRRTFCFSVDYCFLLPALLIPHLLFYTLLSFLKWKLRSREREKGVVPHHRRLPFNFADPQMDITWRLR